MRYIIETTSDGNDNRVWSNLTSLKDKGYITIVEKGDPIEEMKENLRKIARSMQLLKEIGISNELMSSYIYDKTKVNKRSISRVLEEQTEFFKKIGIKLK
jgi:hypothetical protein